MNLDDGTHIIHPHRHALLEGGSASELDEDLTFAAHSKQFIPAHPAFRIIAIAAPVPPYPGYPLDPPFRSRFQARFVDPVGALLALPAPSVDSKTTSSEVVAKIRDIILTTQYASEARDAIDAVSKSTLPAFPQTALAKLTALAAVFVPPPLGELSAGQLARLFITLHPGLLHASFEAWAMLSRQTKECGLGELGSPSNADGEDDSALGLFGYGLMSIEREDATHARISFSGHSPVSLVVPAGPHALLPFPFASSFSELEFSATPRFVGLLTAFVQAHALGWDISYLPPPAPSTASCSTSTLVRVFGEVLGYGNG